MACRRPRGYNGVLKAPHPTTRRHINAPQLTYKAYIKSENAPRVSVFYFTLRFLRRAFRHFSTPPPCGRAFIAAFGRTAACTGAVQFLSTKNTLSGFYALCANGRTLIFCRNMRRYCPWQSSGYRFGESQPFYAVAYKRDVEIFG